MSLDAWHSVRFTRQGRRGRLQVDDQPVVLGTSRGSFTQLTLDLDITLDLTFTLDLDLTLDLTFTLDLDLTLDFDLTLDLDLFVGGHRNFDEVARLADVDRGLHGCVQKVRQEARRLMLVMNMGVGSGVGRLNRSNPCLLLGYGVQKRPENLGNSTFKLV